MLLMSRDGSLAMTSNTKSVEIEKALCYLEQAVNRLRNGRGVLSGFNRNKWPEGSEPEFPDTAEECMDIAYEILSSTRSRQSRLDTVWIVQKQVFSAATLLCDADDIGPDPDIDNGECLAIDVEGGMYRAGESFPDNDSLTFAKGSWVWENVAVFLEEDIANRYRKTLENKGETVQVLAMLVSA